MIRLIVCDLDETLLDSEKTYRKTTGRPSREFEARGGLFVPCTGRIYTSLSAR